MRFKVGDRVRINKPPSTRNGPVIEERYLVGKTGTVIEVPEPYWYLVAFDGSNYAFLENELEPAGDGKEWMRETI